MGFSFGRRLIFSFCSAGVIVMALLFALPAEAVTDSDSDGVSDDDERLVYHTDQWNHDSDKDGFADGVEIAAGYSPRVAGKRQDEVDSDSDGLNDAIEIALGTDIINKDSDGDGYGDGDEVNSGYSPSTPFAETLPKRIEISLARNRLSYFFGSVKMGEFPISAGLARMPTPVGEFKIATKHPKAWSNSSKLWMPWWMNFTGTGARTGRFGIHELPIWPGGKREGVSVLGKPASHGCVRLGIGPAKILFDFAPVGTPVVITKS